MVGAVLLLIIASSAIHVQTTPEKGAYGRDTLDIEELMGEMGEPSPDHSYFFEWMETLRERPLDLNMSDVEDLTEIPFLSPAEAIRIVRHRQWFGPFTSVDSLAAVDGLDPLLIRRLRPFLEVLARSREPGGVKDGDVSPIAASPDPPRSRGRPAFRADIIQRWARKLELADGFRRDSTGYLGGPTVLQTRIRVGVGRFATSVTLDKDAGEPIAWNPDIGQFGYDFLAGHLTAADVGWIRRLVIGDFSLRFAFGNVLRSPGGIGASAALPPIRGTAIRPFASSSEAGHFRGIAAEIAPVPQLSLTAFGSRRRFDARIDTTSAEDLPLLLRRSTGLHRTETEQHGRAAFVETVGGGGIHLTVGPAVVAGMAYIIEDDLDDALLSVGRPVRRKTALASVAIGMAMRRLYVSGEITPPGIYSAGAEFRADRFGTIRVRIRRFGPSAYLPHSMQSSPSTGRVEPITEAATHIRIQPTVRTSLELQTEIIRRETPDRRPPFSSVGATGAVELRHQVRPWVTASVRAVRRHAEDPSICEVSTNATDRIRCLSFNDRRSVRFQIDYRHSRTLESRIRMERVHARLPEADPSNGLLLYHEVRFRPIRQVTVIARLSNFAVDDHASRIYTYENDLLYAFSTPSFIGEGRRAFVFLRIAPSTTLWLEAKCSHSIWENVDSVGSGRDEIEGNRVRELRIQLRWRPFG